MSWIHADNLDCFHRPADPALRQFKVDAHYDLQYEHVDYAPGTSRWPGASPETLNDFSALAYFFGYRLRQKLGVPIGLLNVDLGGSPISSWLDLPSVQAFPPIFHQLDGYRLSGQAAEKSSASLQAISDWYAQLAQHEKQNKRADHPVRTVEMPNFLSDVDLPNFTGEVELSKHFTLTAAQARQATEAASRGEAASGALLRLGTMADRDRAWLNSTFLGGHDNQYEVRDYEIPAGTLHAGENTIRLHLVAEQGNGRLTPGKHLYLRLPGNNVNLNGEWQLRVITRMNKHCPVEDFVRWLPVGLYNRMIAPLAGYGIRAVLWYQGESDTGSSASIYADLLRTLIRLWRHQWGQRLPFYIVQLPAFSIDMAGEDGGWPLVRQGEWSISQTEPNVTTVVTLPDGEWNDLHPRNKEAVARRLALAVEESLYPSATAAANKSEIYQPVLDLQRCRISNGVLVLAFANQSFAFGHPRTAVPVDIRIASGTEDGGTEFVWRWKDGAQTPAQFRISESRVLIDMPAGRMPDEVRYAWSNAPRRSLLAESARADEDDVLVPPFRLDLTEVAD